MLHGPKALPSGHKARLSARASWLRMFGLTFATLPNSHAILRIAVQLVARFQCKRRVKLRLIGNDPIHAILARAVRIGEQALAHFVVAVFTRPDLRIADEETLLAAESIDYRSGLAVQRKSVGAERHRDARQIGKILAERQLAVHELLRQRTERIVLFDEFG